MVISGRLLRVLGAQRSALSPRRLEPPCHLERVNPADTRSSSVAELPPDIRTVITVFAGLHCTVGLYPCTILISALWCVLIPILRGHCSDGFDFLRCLQLSEAELSMELPIFPPITMTEDHLGRPQSYSVFLRRDGNAVKLFKE